MEDIKEIYSMEILSDGRTKLDVPGKFFLSSGHLIANLTDLLCKLEIEHSAHHQNYQTIIVPKGWHISPDNSCLMLDDHGNHRMTFYFGSIFREPDTRLVSRYQLGWYMVNKFIPQAVSFADKAIHSSRENMLLFMDWNKDGAMTEKFNRTMSDLKDGPLKDFVKLDDPAALWDETGSRFDEAFSIFKEKWLASGLDLFDSSEKCERDDQALIRRPESLKPTAG